MWLEAYAVGITVALITVCIYNYKKSESLFYKYQDKVTQIQMEEVNHIYMTMQSRHVKR